MISALFLLDYPVVRLSGCFATWGDFNECEDCFESTAIKPMCVMGQSFWTLFS